MSKTIYEQSGMIALSKADVAKLFKKHQAVKSLLSDVKSAITAVIVQHADSIEDNGIRLVNETSIVDQYETTNVRSPSIDTNQHRIALDRHHLQYLELDDDNAPERVMDIIQSYGASSPSEVLMAVDVNLFGVLVEIDIQHELINHLIGASGANNVDELFVFMDNQSANKMVVEVDLSSGATSTALASSITEGVTKH